MRFPICVLAFTCLASCVPARPVAQARAAQQPRPPVVVKKPAPQPVAATSAPQRVVAGPGEKLRLTSKEVGNVRLTGVAFDSREHRLKVVDQPRGPGSMYANVASAARSVGGVAGVNAGFFTPEGQPLGILVSSGKPAGAWNSASSIGNAVWYRGPNGVSEICRRDKIGRKAAATMPELLQSGPLLVENGNAVEGMETDKVSGRMALLWDGGNRWWIGRASPCTLDAFGKALATGSPAGWPVKMALNLDGGRSVDFWASSAVPGGPQAYNAPFNKPVRNFLVLIPK